MRLSSYMKEFREKNNISLRTMADLCECSYTQIMYLENEEVFPSPDRLKKIASVMKISYEEAKSMCVKEIDGEIKAYLTEKEIKNRKL